MLRKERVSMREAAVIIEKALRAVGCNAPIEVIDHNTAIRIGTAVEHLTIRYNNNAKCWEVAAYTPYFQQLRSYETLEACAHDIALCDEHGVAFHRIDETEREIDEAIEKAELALHC